MAANRPLASMTRSFAVHDDEAVREAVEDHRRQPALALGPLERLVERVLHPLHGAGEQPHLLASRARQVPGEVARGDRRSRARQLCDRPGNAPGGGGPDEERGETHADDRGAASTTGTGLLDPPHVVRGNRDAQDAAVGQQPRRVDHRRPRGRRTTSAPPPVRAPAPRAPPRGSLWFSMAATSLPARGPYSCEHPAVRRDERDAAATGGSPPPQDRVRARLAQGAEPRHVIGEMIALLLQALRHPLFDGPPDRALRGEAPAREPRPPTGRRTGE